MQVQEFKSVLIRRDLKTSWMQKEPSSSKQVVDLKFKQQGNIPGVGELYWPVIQPHFFLYFRAKIPHTLTHNGKQNLSSFSVPSFSRSVHFKKKKKKPNKTNFQKWEIKRYLCPGSIGYCDERAVQKFS